MLVPLCGREVKTFLTFKIFHAHEDICESLMERNKMKKNKMSLLKQKQKIMTQYDQMEKKTP